jgi:2-methylisocitrate lyase-like PEP mutase family enzyme
MTIESMRLDAKATALRRLHDDPELLVLVNVWDVISATVIADLPGTTALATASHSIAASHGYPDGEKIPLDLMIAAIGRIAAAVDIPVSADLEAGYGNAGETVRRAIGAGIVGANLEDEMRRCRRRSKRSPPPSRLGTVKACRSCSMPARTHSCEPATVRRKMCWPTRLSEDGLSWTLAPAASSSPASSTGPP